ncbi:hypothetical protein HK103_002410 [Boothiomyces macroporosus]|uniref:Uncharacterized protein n=1 Tax=Boothiomyces macroporosus TaxID=261099 RepID=A0AAD5Y4S8_9FUNG|nr:hypothetical protein HK103_002410 [Boothiomyces macroporosus]
MRCTKMPDTLVSNTEYDLMNLKDDADMVMDDYISFTMDPFQFFIDPDIYKHLSLLSTFWYFPFAVRNGNLVLLEAEKTSLVYQKAIICNSIFYSIHPKLFPSVASGVLPTYQDKVNLATLIYLDLTFIKPKERYSSDREMVEDFKGLFAYASLLGILGYPDKAIRLFQETYLLAVRYGLFNPNEVSDNITVDDLAKLIDLTDLQKKESKLSTDEWDCRLLLYNLCLTSDTFQSMIHGIQFVVDDTLFDQYLGTQNKPFSAAREIPHFKPSNDYIHAENTIWQGTDYASTYESLQISCKIFEYINAKEFCKSSIKRTKIQRRIINFSRSKVKDPSLKHQLLVDLDSCFQLDLFEPEFRDLTNFLEPILVKNTKFKVPHSYTIPLSNLIMYSYLNQHETEPQLIKPGGEKYEINVIFKAVFNYLVALIQSANCGNGINPHLQPPTVIFLVYCIASSCLVKTRLNEMKREINRVILPVLKDGAELWQVCKPYVTQMEKLLNIL